MNREIDIELVREQIETDVHRKRSSGELSEALERALDREFDRASPASHHAVATGRNRHLVRFVKRAGGAARRRWKDFRKAR